MGYDQDKRRALYVLRFDDDPVLAGLVIQCRKPGYRATRQLARAALVLGDDLSVRGLTSDVLLAAWEPLFTALRKSVRQWNLMDGGRSVPISELLDQDIPFLLQISRAWYREVVLLNDQVTADPQPVDNAGDEQLEAQASPVTGAPSVDEEWLAQLPARELGPDSPELAAIMGDHDVDAVIEDDVPEDSGVVPSAGPVVAA